MAWYNDCSFGVEQQSLARSNMRWCIFILFWFSCYLKQVITYFIHPIMTYRYAVSTKDWRQSLWTHIDSFIILILVYFRAPKVKKSEKLERSEEKMSVTVNNVTVIITDYVPKTVKKERRTSTETNNQVDNSDNSSVSGGSNCAGEDLLMENHHHHHHWYVLIWSLTCWHPHYHLYYVYILFIFISYY